MCGFYLTNLFDSDRLCADRFSHTSRLSKTDFHRRIRTISNLFSDASIAEDHRFSVNLNGTSRLRDYEGSSDPETLKYIISMASARPYWEQHHDMNSLFFCFDGDSIEHNLKTHQQSSVTDGFEKRMFAPCSSHSSSQHCQSLKAVDPKQLLLLSRHIPPEGDQVVPSFQKLSVYEQMPPFFTRRCSKPLPPLPDMEDLSSDEAADSEVEFFSSKSENQLLVSERPSKPFTFRYGAPGRRSFRGCGQINYAYHDVLQEQENAGGQKCERDQASAHRDSLKQERPQRRLRRSNSGPAGSFKSPSLRQAAHNHHHHHHTSLGQPQEKPEVPPRVPIPCRPKKLSNVQDSERPPEIPPRQPIYYITPRVPSPKSLPIYVNGVMPPTQSFAPNPNYVSKAQPRQNCESLPPPRTPCILPIMEDGKKASTTHYILLPQRPGYLDRFERFFKESHS